MFTAIPDGIEVDPSLVEQARRERLLDTRQELASVQGDIDRRWPGWREWADNQAFLASVDPRLDPLGLVVPRRAAEQGGVGR